MLRPICAGQVWSAAGRNERIVDAVGDGVVLNHWNGSADRERTTLAGFRAWVRKHNAATLLADMVVERSDEG